MRTAIKITLNSSVPFDAVILDYLKGKKNKAGQLKMLAYNQIVLTKVQAIESSLTNPDRLSTVQGSVVAGKSTVQTEEVNTPSKDAVQPSEKMPSERAEITAKLNKLLNF
ncbi:MAG: hypothetical protein AB1553_05650 [Nitrospirota bacterium]